VYSVVQPEQNRAQSRPAADLIITNAKIWTVDKSMPSAEAVAVLGDRIVAVGSSADVDAWRGPHTHVNDAGGKLLLPGFNDAHVHFVSGGKQLDSVQLNDASTPQEFARRIGERAKVTSKGEWITGGNWDETKWNPPNLPTKELIDALTPNTPVFVNRYDGHMGLANSVALRLAGITAETPDPPGGRIVRDAEGNPTGALKDAATDYIDKVIPPLSHEQRLRIVKRALAYAASVGVTSVQHMVADYEDIAVYSELLQRGELTTRIYAAPLITHVDDQAKLGIGHAFGGPYLRIGALKAFADGSLGSGTAYFYKPFLNQGNNHGLLSDEMHPISLMRDRYLKADAAGLQICTHAIGDKAISTILGLYADVIKTHGESDRRFRKRLVPRTEAHCGRSSRSLYDGIRICRVSGERKGIHHAGETGRYGSTQRGHLLHRSRKNQEREGVENLRRRQDGLGFNRTREVNSAASSMPAFQKAVMDSMDLLYRSGKLIWRVAAVLVRQGSRELRHCRQDLYWRRHGAAFGSLGQHQLGWVRRARGNLLAHGLRNLMISTYLFHAQGFQPLPFSHEAIVESHVRLSRVELAHLESGR
jgi:hypothetical protein